MWDTSLSPHPAASAAATVQTPQSKPAHTSSLLRPVSLPQSGSAGAATFAMPESFDMLLLRNIFLVFSTVTTLYFRKERGVSHIFS